MNATVSRLSFKEWADDIVWDDAAFRTVEERLTRDPNPVPWKTCDVPEAWDTDPTVCGHCGRSLTAHTPASQPSYRPYREAIWIWLLRHGGIPDYFGGIQSGYTEVAADHVLNGCALGDVKLPKPDRWNEFVGTDADSATVAGLGGDLSCACGKIVDLPWCLKGEVTVGEIIFQVVNAGAI